jgi:hypothetical protein
MIRANLLPRPRTKIDAFGFQVDGEFAREVVLSLAVVVTVAAIGFGIETLRLHRISIAAIDSEAALANRVAERNEARALALSVARYQEIAREAVVVRRSGPAAELAIAQVGNAVPEGVWLDSLAQVPSGLEVTGAAYSLDAVSTAMLALGSAFPSRRIALVAIDNRDGRIRFTARIPPAESSDRE